MTVKDFLALEGHAYGMKATLGDMLEVLEPEEMEEWLDGLLETLMQEQRNVKTRAEMPVKGSH